MNAIAAYTIDTGDGWAHAETVIPIAAELANRDAADPDVRRWATMAIRAAGVPRDDVEGEARALLAAVQRDVRYTEDPIERRPDGVWETRELVQSPTATLQLRAGDCIALATLLAAALQSVGRIPRFNVVAWEPGQPRHVTVEVQTPRGWYTIDPVTVPARLGIDAAMRGSETRMFVVPGVGAPPGAVLVEQARCGSCGIGADDRPTLDELTRGRLDELERDYGTTIREVSSVAEDAVDVVSRLSSATSNEEVLAAVDAGFSAVCSLADMAGAGGVCRAVAKGIIKVAGWLVSTWPARPLYPEPYIYYSAAVRTGFTPPGRSDAEYTAAISQMWGAGWLVFWQERRTGVADAPQIPNMGTFGDRMLGLNLGSQGLGTDRAALGRAFSARVAAMTAWARGDFAEGDRICDETFPNGLARAFAIRDAQPDAWISENVDPHDRIPCLLVCFHWDAIPAELRRAVGLCLFAPRDRWPDDPGVQFLTNIILRRDVYEEGEPFWSPELIAFVARATGQAIPPEFGEEGVEPVEAARVSPAAFRTAFPGLELAPALTAFPVEPAAPAEPVQVAPAAPPAVVAAAELPRTIPEGVTTPEAQVLAAIRYYDATEQARRADAAARAYHGIGAVPVRIVDAVTEAEIAATFGTAAQLAATTDVRTRARRANYGLTHIVDLGLRRVAERLMSWKKARGDAAVDSTVTDDIRNALAADGEFPLGAAPTVEDVAAAVVEAGGGAAAEAVQVLPASDPDAGTPELVIPAGQMVAAGMRPVSALPLLPTTTETGLPAAPAPGVPAVQAPEAPAELPPGGVSEAFPAGAPAGATMILPPGSAEITVRQKASPALLVLLLLGIYAANRRRRRT